MQHFLGFCEGFWTAINFPWIGKFIGSDIFQALYYKKYSAASDIWSYGIVMFEVWSLGRKPYEGRGVQEVRI